MRNRIKENFAFTTIIAVALTKKISGYLLTPEKNQKKDRKSNKKTFKYRFNSEMAF